jgi:hypothetical protein
VDRDYWTPHAGGQTSPPINVTNGGSGGAISFTVNEDADWIEILADTSFSGETPGSFIIQAAANTTGATREVTITISSDSAPDSPRYLQVSQHRKTLNFQSATLNDIEIDLDNPVISVQTGTPIVGDVTITASNFYGCSTCIMPFAWTPTWGTHSSSWVQIDGFVPHNKTSNYTANINLIAPAVPGNYYLWFIMSAKYNASEMMANDRPAVWGDGDDIADMGEAQFLTASVWGEAAWVWNDTPVDIDAVRGIKVIVYDTIPTTTTSTSTVPPSSSSTTTSVFIVPTTTSTTTSVIPTTSSTTSTTSTPVITSTTTTSTSTSSTTSIPTTSTTSTSSSTSTSSTSTSTSSTSTTTSIYTSSTTTSSTSSSTSISTTSSSTSVSTTTSILPGGDIALVLDPNAGTWGNSFRGLVNIANNDNSVSAFGIDLTYDTSLFTYLGVERGSLTADWGTLSGNEVSPGLVRMGGFRGGGTEIPTDSSGSLVHTLFQVKCVAAADGLQKAFSIGAYTDDIAGFTPSPAADTFTYRLCSRLGDTNDDDNITPGDAQRAFEIYLGLLIPDDCQKTTSDANCSGATTPGDAQWIFEHYLGLRTLPTCCAESMDAQIEESFRTKIQSISIIPSLDHSQFPAQNPTQNPWRLSVIDTIGGPGERVLVPIISDRLDELDSFGFDVVFPADLMDYAGFIPGPYSGHLEIDSQEIAAGLIQIHGKSRPKEESTSDTPPGLSERPEQGSLVLLAFDVKESAGKSGAVTLFNLRDGLFGSGVENGVFTHRGFRKTSQVSVLPGTARTLPDGTFSVPVLAGGTTGLKAFGFEVVFDPAKMQFIGVNSTPATARFIQIGANEIAPGLVRVGGYSASPILSDNHPRLVELIFLPVAGQASDIRIFQTTDDLLMR